MRRNGHQSSFGCSGALLCKLRLDTDADCRSHVGTRHTSRSQLSEHLDSSLFQLACHPACLRPTNETYSSDGTAAVQSIAHALVAHRGGDHALTRRPGMNNCARLQPLDGDVNEVCALGLQRGRHRIKCDMLKMLLHA